MAIIKATLEFATGVDDTNIYLTTFNVFASCTRCDHRTGSYGHSGASIRRCLVMLREGCPRNEKNYYVVGEG
jgi:hypothetical protein